MNKSSTGLSENDAGLLCYVAGWITGIIFILIERSSKFVLFHAIQSIIVFGVVSVAIAIFGNIPVVGLGFRIAFGIIAFVLWILLMVRAHRGERFKIRWAGDFAEKWAERHGS